MSALGDLFTVDFNTATPWIALLVIFIGTVLFFLLKGLLVPKPYHDHFVKLAETERDNRRRLEEAVMGQSTALSAIADGVEAIKEHTVPRWKRGGR